jgi:hypothetical protein
MKLKNLLSALFAGAVAVSMMAFASFADETSDTEPIEVDPDEITEEIIEDETTEEIVEDVTTAVEEIVETTTVVITAEETTAPAAGDTTADGNPKTGVAIAIIPALAAVAAVVASRKRK